MTVDEAYRYCRAIAHKHGANFSVGFRFLPRAKRRAVYAAYAYCRVADDIADEDPGVVWASGLPASPPPGSRPEAHTTRAGIDGVTAGGRSGRRSTVMAQLDAWQSELE